ncbi:MAG TPA: MarR family winged helix-turn-helix transcriptional regulator [Polyangia bacterium]|jgi:DNA-binding MarR family transcriptional regulator|nr:MarR family winged helix-turn-helix transcriptional regulator [Polyangia bacterium]
MGAHGTRSDVELSTSLTTALSVSSDAQSVLDAFRRIVRQLRLSARDAEKTVKLSGAQLFVLERLAEAPASSIAELATRTLTDPSSVSVVVQRLVARGLVSRRRASKDARRAELTITAAGRRRLARAPEPVQARLVEALLRLPERELRSLARGLTTLIQEMGAEGEAPTMFFEEEAPARPASARSSRTAQTSRRSRSPRVRG